MTHADLRVIIDMLKLVQDGAEERKEEKTVAQIKTIIEA